MIDKPSINPGRFMPNNSFPQWAELLFSSPQRAELLFPSPSGPGFYFPPPAGRVSISLSPAG